MNTIINILPWALAIAVGLLYYFKIKENKGLELERNNLLDSEREKHLAHIKALDETYESLRNVKEEKNAIQEQLYNRIQSLEAENQALKYDFQEQANGNKEFNEIIEPINPEDFPHEFRVKVGWGTIDLSIKDLIGDDKLLEVFNSLVRSKLLPESIKDSIDYEPKEHICLIWTNDVNVDGEAIFCLTWKEIITQILTKKQIITDYLKGVIQDSDRAMVVHQALTSKPKKEVSNA